MQKLKTSENLNIKKKFRLFITKTDYDIHNEKSISKWSESETEDNKTEDVNSELIIILLNDESNSEIKRIK